MGNTSAPVTVGGGVRNLLISGKNDQTMVTTKVTMSGSYATGGDTVVASAYQKRGKLAAVEVRTPVVGTRVFAWDGSTTTPKIKAFTAYPATEVTSATSLSGVELLVRFTYDGA